MIVHRYAILQNHPAVLACWNREEGQRSLVRARPLHPLVESMQVFVCLAGIGQSVLCLSWDDSENPASFVKSVVHRKTD